MDWITRVGGVGVIACALAIGAGIAGCGGGLVADDGGAMDQATPMDMTAAADLTAAPDLVAPADLSMADLAMVDLAIPVDLVVVPDLLAPPDLAVPSDLLVARDLVSPPDVSAPPDLVRLPDLVTPPDLAVVRDLATAPDLSTPPDLAMAPDLAMPGDMAMMVVTYSGAVQPILGAKCAPCHTVGGAGGANFAAKYADTQLASYYCPGKTKGACTIVRVQDGTMPAGGGCSGNPANDVNKPNCLTAMEQMILLQWIAGGQQP